MVGGQIIEVRAMDSGVRLWCVSGNDETAIYVKEAAELPACGDTVWWQGRKAYWTPKDRRFQDRELERVGFSFDPAREPGVTR